MTKVATCLWFNGQAEEAARLYTSLIPDSRINRVDTAAADNPSTQKGDVLTVDFTVGGHDLIALNGGPEFQFNESMSLSVLCEDQAEVDRLWSSLILGGGEPSQCGWLKDKYGVSWQIVPKILAKMIKDKDVRKSQKVINAMLQMQKLDIKTLLKAYEEI